MKQVTALFVKSALTLKDCPAWGIPEVALAGRSNVGKSSFLNKMVNRKALARTSNTPGRTRMLNFFIIDEIFGLVDLPGYGYARVPEGMKSDWGVYIREYLEKRPNLAGVVQLLDIRHRPTEMDIQLFAWLKAARLPVITVATKLDKLSKNQARNQIRVIREAIAPGEKINVIGFSAKTGQGREEVWVEMERLIGQNSGARIQNKRD